MTADTADGLTLSYRLTGNPLTILLPTPTSPSPADGLWQHTCCEAFIAGPEGSDYREFNFSPSGQWACYRFADYRQRDTDFTAPAQPQIALHTASDGFRLDVTLPASLLPSGNTLAIGLTAVLEGIDGNKSYWALAHGATQPDFHLRQSFVLTLHRTTP